MVAKGLPRLDSCKTLSHFRPQQALLPSSLADLGRQRLFLMPAPGQGCPLEKHALPTHHCSLCPAYRLENGLITTQLKTIDYGHAKIWDDLGSIFLSIAWEHLSSLGY